MTEARDIEARLEELHDDLAFLRQGRLRDRAERERWLHEDPAGWELIQRHMETGGCSLEEAMNELLAPAGEATPGKPVAASEQAPMVGGAPLWEESAPVQRRSRAGSDVPVLDDF